MGRGMPVSWCILVSARNAVSIMQSARSIVHLMLSLAGYGRSASSEVVLHLVRPKCIPALLYGLNACLINATDFKSLQHPITNIFMKMFATKSAEVVTECQQAFGFQPIRNHINCRKIKFLNRYVTCPNCICSIACNQCAVNEIQYLVAEQRNV